MKIHFLLHTKNQFQIKTQQSAEGKWKIWQQSIGVHVKCVNGLHICITTKEPTRVFGSLAAERQYDHIVALVLVVYCKAHKTDQP